MWLQGRGERQEVGPAGLSQTERGWYLTLSAKEFLAEFKGTCEVPLIYI